MGQPFHQPPILPSCALGFETPTSPSCPRRWWDRSRFSWSFPLFSVSLRRPHSQGREVFAWTWPFGWWIIWQEEWLASPPFWRDLPTRRREPPHGSPHLAFMCPHRYTSDASRSGPRPGAAGRGPNKERALGCGFCVLWAFWSDLNSGERTDAGFSHARPAQDKLCCFVFCLERKKITHVLTGSWAPSSPLVLDLLEDLTTRICL